MTSLAFIAGLVPLVLATGAGAIGNKTIGGSALGGMVSGTLLGVILIPGLYYFFAHLIKGKSYIREEYDEPISEAFIRQDEETNMLRKQIKKLSKLVNRNKKDENQD
jgi:HAE1 family hydrophobic/amphiphilic exporter-1